MQEKFQIIDKRSGEKVKQPRIGATIEIGTYFYGSTISPEQKTTLFLRTYSEVVSIINPTDTYDLDIKIHNYQPVCVVINVMENIKE